MKNRTWIQVNSIDWCETGNAKVPCLSFTRLHESISSTNQVFSKILWELGLEPKKTWSTIFLFQSDKWYLISELDWRINMSVICIIVYDVNQTIQFKLTCAPIQIMLIIRMYPNVKGKGVTWNSSSCWKICHKAHIDNWLALQVVYASCCGCRMNSSSWIFSYRSHIGMAGRRAFEYYAWAAYLYWRSPLDKSHRTKCTLSCVVSYGTLNKQLAWQRTDIHRI